MDKKLLEEYTLEKPNGVENADIKMPYHVTDNVPYFSHGDTAHNSYDSRFWAACRANDIIGTPSAHLYVAEAPSKAW